MPVSYYSSTGTISFSPVTRRDQAVGPMEVAVSPSAPDEIIEPGGGSYAGRFHRFEIMLAITTLTAIALLIFAGSIS